MTTLILSLLVAMSIQGRTSVEPTTVAIERLDLAGCVALAMQNSPAISSAEASLLSAEASLTNSKAFLWPSLSMSAGVSRNWSTSELPDGSLSDNEMNSFSTSLNLSQELLASGGQNWLYLEASELSMQASLADNRGEILSITQNVINAYYSVLEAEELKVSAEAAYARSLNQLERTEALYEIGGVTTLDLLQIQVQESGDKLSVIRNEQSLFSAYNDLFNAIGIDADVNNFQINPDAILQPLSMESVSRIPLDYSNNPSFLAASFRLRASEYQSDAAGRAYWPSLRANAGWSWNDNTLDDVDRMFDTDGYNAGLSLSWNIFDGFRRESAVKSSRATYLSSRASIETLENNLKASLESLSNSLRIDIQYYNNSKQMLEQTEEQYRLSLMSYEMGALPLLDLLKAQSDLAQSEANLVSARVSALRTEASLLIQLGEMPRVGE